METVQDEEQERGRRRKGADAQGPGDNIKKSNTCNWCLRRRGERRGQENILESGGNFPNFAKGIN